MVNMIKFDTVEEKLAHLASLTNIPSINPKKYSPDNEYHRLDFISHSEFGLGFIEEVLNDGELLAFFSKGNIRLSQKSYLKESAV